MAMEIVVYLKKPTSTTLCHWHQILPSKVEFTSLHRLQILSLTVGKLTSNFKFHLSESITSSQADEIEGIDQSVLLVVLGLEKFLGEPEPLYLPP